MRKRNITVLDVHVKGNWLCVYIEKKEGNIKHQGACFLQRGLQSQDEKHKAHSY